ncbi:cation-translocating P-type ATPase [Lignipirellula cremea]|uniref:Putative cation-transporting ATPase F n=1 Tax=Lignipirellula cremea TaxID=2528010 RepID=A0A518E457_9BACT|nr:HAD-IC family P-type ATPase [Lignipirellula cremea]QDU98880.1 putative cation-transporting ATPase F [Lignipirellula cremea]
MSQQKQPLAAWHAMGLADVLSRLNASERGLSEDEARLRLSKYGPNRLPQKPPTALWQIVLRQFASPLIYILALAAIVSVAIGDVKDAAFIAGVLVLNAVIGAWQEWKAEKSSHALRKLLQIRASVHRDEEVREICAEDVVPGDVIWLESGNRAPADLRLLSAHGFEADESLLTGESMPVPKDPTWPATETTPVADRQNMAYAGSIVTRGRAKGLVIATGAATSVGQLALDVMGEGGGKPPLLVRMERFTRVIAIAVLAAAVTIGVLGVTLGGYSISEMFMFTIAMAVSAIPEGLPVAMTVALAIATSRMARRGLIVRRLTAVEGLGSCTLIATDKTGTLTCNELTVREVQLPDGGVFQVTGEGFAPLGEVLFQEKPIEPGKHAPLQWLTRAGILCNEADLHHRHEEWVWRGDAVDVAFLSFAHKSGWTQELALDLHPQVNQIPFEPEHQFAASYHTSEGGVSVFVKGGPERVLGMCTESSSTDFDRVELEECATRMAARGYRVLALADGDLNEPMTPEGLPPAPANLRFLGFVGMIDPLRTGVKDAVRDCNAAGVAVSMITGDHQVTALAIARNLGLASDESQVMTGAELQGKSPEELGEIVGRIRVFARVAPRQKLQIVEAARRAGQFVAVTGDGVNDAPALRVANIGVAMGKSGTDVAREAAELVISDDNFATIVAGIEEGRVAYDNIRKVIYLLISTGAAELVLMALAITTGMPYLPLLPVQILWLNLVTNGIQDVALAFEPNEGGVLKRKPRSPGERIFDQLMIERTLVAAIVIGGIGFLTFRWFLPDGASDAEVASARNALLLLMVLFENIHIGNCRSETKSALLLSPLRSPILLAGTITAFLIHLAAMHTPLGQMLLGAEPIPLRNWGVLFLLAFTIFPVMELHKWSWNMRHRNPA